MQRRLIVWMVAAICLAGRAQGAPGTTQGWEVVVAPVGASAPVRNATEDLRRYLAQATGHMPRLSTPTLWSRSDAPAVRLEISPRIPGVGPQGYMIRRDLRGARVMARTAEGLVNGVYGLLRELGFGFYLGSEAIPARLPDRLPRDCVTANPALTVRGVLPWYNFLNSPTTWDPIDHRALIDQLIRGGANFVGFHTYDSEPFGAFSAKGRMTLGARLLNTASPIWGTTPQPTSRFGFGTDRLFADPHFGARTSLDVADPDSAVRQEQAVLRDAFAYAHSRGVRTCLGFEITGDPTLPAERATFLKRIDHLMDAYPDIDYIWLWQAETGGATGWMGPSSAALARYAAFWRAAFARAVDRTRGDPGFFQATEEGKQARALEGARLALYALMAHRRMSARSRAPRLVISGWGGDDRILSAEYYAGLDSLLPSDVVFASLDHISPRDRVDGVYHALSKTRERWPIPWLECDGDQWHPQPHVHTLEALARDLLRSGSQGFLGIHWRTRDVEEDFAYLTQYAWRPGLTAEAFFADYAHRCYGPSLAAPMAAIHSELDRLGYRWIGGWGQSECGSFAWSPSEPRNVSALRAIRGKAAALLSGAGAAAPRLRHLISMMDWGLAWAEVERRAVAAAGLLDRAQRPDASPDLAKEAVALLDDRVIATAMRTYACRITTRGEYGVLATINGKAFAAWQALRGRALAACGASAEASPAGPWEPEPAVQMPRLLTSAAAGTPLTLEPIVFGGPAWLRWRPIGAVAWRSIEVPIVRGAVGRVTLPAAAIRPPGVEVGFTLGSPRSPFAWGPTAVTALPAPSRAAPSSRRAQRRAPAIALRVGAAPRAAALLRWQDVPGADAYRVISDGHVIAETPAAEYPDLPRRLHTTYRVEALGAIGIVARSPEVAYTVPDLPVRTAVNLTARANSVGALLTWLALEDTAIVEYAVRRRPAAGGPWSEIATQPAIAGRHRVLDRPSPGEWQYSVAARNARGHAGPVALATTAAPAPAALGPAVEAALTAAPAGATLEGAVRFGPDGVRTDDGAIVFAPRPGLDMADGLTVAFRFRADSTSEMPVLLCHGQWQSEGWFVQILGGRLLIRTAHGDAEGPLLEAGRWYDVRWVYDGATQRLKVNGVWIPQATPAMAPSASARGLIVGQYEVREARYRFRGIIRDLTITPDILAD